MAAPTFTPLQYNDWRSDLFEHIQLGAGILCSTFSPDSPTVDKSSIIGATTGGISFTQNVTMTDFGEDIDNVPAHTWQLQMKTDENPKISGTFVTVNKSLLQQLCPGMDIGNALTSPEEDGNFQQAKYTPRKYLKESDFINELWAIASITGGDGVSGGCLAIKMNMALSTGGFQWQSTKDGKGQFAFEFSGHYDLNDNSKQPWEMYYMNTSALQAGAGVMSVMKQSASNVSTSTSTTSVPKSTSTSSTLSK